MKRSGFEDREVTRSDRVWWKLWRNYKDELKLVGFAVRKTDQGQRWLVSYRPPPNADQRHPPLAEREAIWPEYHEALARCREAAEVIDEVEHDVDWKRTGWRRDFEAALDEATAAGIVKRKVHRRLRRLYTSAEWVAVVALAALDGVEIAVTCSAVPAVLIKDEAADRPERRAVVNLAQVRALRRAEAEGAKPGKYLIARTGNRFRRAHLWDGVGPLCGKWPVGDLHRRREEFEVRDDTGGWDVCCSCEMAARAALRWRHTDGAAADAPSSGGTPAA